MLEQNLLSSVQSTIPSSRVLPVQALPHWTPSGPRVDKDICHPKGTPLLVEWMHSEPRVSFNLSVPFSLSHVCAKTTLGGLESPFSVYSPSLYYLLLHTPESHLFFLGLQLPLGGPKFYVGESGG